MLTRTITSLLLSILLGDINCSPDIAGNSSETTNRVAIALSNSGAEGIAPGKSKVYLFNREYIPAESQPGGYRDSVLTGSDGKFSFDNVVDGYYNLLCEDTLGYKSFTALTIGSQLSHNDTIYDTLRATGSIKGNCPHYSYIDSIGLVVYIKGSPYKSSADSSGTFLLDGLPAGDYTVQGIKINLSSGFSPVTTENSKELRTVSVIPDSTVQIQWQNW